MFTDTAAHTMLDALDIAYAALHAAYPGADGADAELSGGNYARRPVALQAASARARTLSAPVTFEVPSGATVAWLSWRKADGSCVAVTPLGGEAPRAAITDPATDIVTCENHGFADGYTVVFSGEPPAGLQTGVIYHVRDVAGDTFRVAAAAGGAAVDITADGVARVTRIVPEIYNNAGTYQLTGAVLALE